MLTKEDVIFVEDSLLFYDKISWGLLNRLIIENPISFDREEYKLHRVRHGVEDVLVRSTVLDEIKSQVDTDSYGTIAKRI